MPAKGVADHIERTLGVAVLVDGGGQVQVRPVQVIHFEAAQAGRFRLTDAAVVQGQGAVTAARRVFGKAPIETLGHAGGAGDQQLRDGLGGVVERGDQWVTVEGRQLQGFAKDGGDLGVHGRVPSGRCCRVRLNRASTARLSGSLLPATRACSRPPSYRAIYRAARLSACSAS